MRRAALLLATLSLTPPAGCGRAEDSCRLSVRLRLTGFKAHASLAETPAVLHVRVEAADLAEPVTGNWAGALGEAPALELSVPAGPDRRLVLVAFLNTEQGVVTYKGLVEHLDLTPGTAEVDVEARPAPTWTLDVLVVGDQGIQELSVLDVETGTVWPPKPARAGHDGLQGTFQDLPVGRFFYLLYRRGETENWAEPADFCPLYSGQATSRYEVLDLQARSCGLGR